MDYVDLDMWIEAQTPPVYEELLEIRANDSGDKDEDMTGEMRRKAIREAAFGMAAQTALAWRYDKLLHFTKSQEGTLDRIANFAPFIADKHMLLPSVTEVRDRYELARDDQKLRTVTIQYRIDDPPKAITQAPTWRDYLWREFPFPEDPHPTLLPRNEREVLLWRAAVENGWRSGLEQAHLSWTDNLNTLVKDIRGRITYRILEARGIVQRPVMVGTQPELTTSSDGRVLNAGDTIYSVAVPMAFKSQNHWDALWVSLDQMADSPGFDPQDYPGFETENMPVFGGAGENE